MTTLEIEPDDSESVRYGASVSDLQTGVELDGDDFVGTLKYFDGSDWESGAWDADDAKGDYLSFNVVNADSDSRISFEIDSDVSDKYRWKIDDTTGNVVLRIPYDAGTDDAIAITATVDGEELTRTCTLGGLTITNPPEPENDSQEPTEE